MATVVETHEGSEKFAVAFSARSAGGREVGITLPASTFDAIANFLGDTENSGGSDWVSVKDSDEREITFFRGA